jgi:hypothetical protein
VTKDVADAVLLLNLAASELQAEYDSLPWSRIDELHSYWIPMTCLLDAIRYLTQPDRLVYPKTRKGTKTQPVRLTR